MYYNIIWGAFV